MESDTNPANPGKIPKKSKYAKFWIILQLFTALACAIGLAIGHHLYLQSLHNKDIANYSQFRVKVGSTAFTQFVTWALMASATIVLSQVVRIVIDSGN